ncbi:PaaI family thioesterase [Aneurinibacillus sp. Ricciae_BoGa-3]|uniref:PaaI family thioesterase n=1 Tax=Aneurinibacillus sp. Ricciae_BoGa-3 TaxID=3022697 RepID=UPI0023408ED0|nr:PaaI family thioesterase [Aneurinibacillus sp. Ricciae_BoGa-3]WCK53360.1 PaaI family thioesterase [Aneurinibacillus sp. Ricciae_BoGa-3]
MEQYKEALAEFVSDILENGTDDEQQILFLARQAIEYKRAQKAAYLTGFLGLQGEYLEDGTYRFEVPITAFMYNRLKIVHGGISATIADYTMGALANHVSGKPCVTSEMKINYLSPGTGEKLLSTASLLRKGSHMCVCECKIYNERAELVLAASGTFFYVEG